MGPEFGSKSESATHAMWFGSVSGSNSFFK